MQESVNVSQRVRRSLTRRIAPARSRKAVWAKLRASERTGMGVYFRQRRRVLRWGAVGVGPAEMNDARPAVIAALVRVLSRICEVKSWLMPLRYA